MILEVYIFSRFIASTHQNLPHVQLTFYTFFILQLGALVVIQALYNALYYLIIAINLFGFEIAFLFHLPKALAYITSVNSVAYRKGFVLLP